MTHDEMARELEETGGYRVLRRLEPRAPRSASGTTAIILDVETTGLDPKTDSIIELAMLPFVFDDGTILGAGPLYSAFQEPSVPIPAEITELTGITAEMVAGQRIDPEAVAALIEPAPLIIAHHAGFDRPFVERFFPVFKKKFWACSMTEIDWRAEGIESTKLGWILQHYGYFAERHRAGDDCSSLLEILDWRLPRSGERAFARLLTSAREPTYRIWALNSPFDAKDLLKGRGYRWSPGEGGQPKSWYIDVRLAALDSECHFLRERVYHRYSAERMPWSIARYTAQDRYGEGWTP